MPGLSRRAFLATVAGLSAAWAIPKQALGSVLAAPAALGEGTSTLQQAIAIEPAYEVAHLALSKLLLIGGDVGGAVTTLTNFLAAYPDSPGACQQLALILQRVGQRDAAQRIGRRAVQLLTARSLDHEAQAMDRLLAAT